MNLVRLGAALVFLALAVVGVVGAAGPPLSGSVGPGFAISLRDAAGATVTGLASGEYALTVEDKSDEHNFHLRGPGVDVATEIETLDTKTFTLNLVDGKYTFVCDPHAGQMNGSFTVGESAPPSPPPATKPAARLNLTVTSKTVRLTTSAGKPVTKLALGLAVITVRDRSAVRGARLAGAGVKRATGVKFVGTVTWKVKLSTGTLLYGGDARKPVLKGGGIPVS